MADGSSDRVERTINGRVHRIIKMPDGRFRITVRYPDAWYHIRHDHGGQRPRWWRTAAAASRFLDKLEQDLRERDSDVY